eukprot:CAMPEP_0115577106 /NCGR_PEP_ID=MMETSP0272-20121206/2901_1 /TAXON_ID=71861 /ORGANISM="Scrippsiella trochoidea, Strain CCMP3099" /LENGTH=943 /DNA_ID=CAMNT_0003011907 /DNA_START=1 /DNA_END=2833 /DNA_ORIENTATION=-
MRKVLLNVSNMTGPRFKHSKPTQLEGCVTLKDCAFDSQELWNRVMKGGACEAVVAALKRYADDSSFQREACLAIANLARDGTEALQRLLKAGAVVSVVTTLEKAQAQGNMTLQRASSRAVARLSHDVEGCRPSLVEAGACEAVVSAMRSCKDSELQGWCCMAVASLAGEEVGLRRCVQAGAPALVVSAVRNLAADSFVQKEGCAALGNLAAAGTDVIEELAEEGACCWVLRAMVDFGNDQEMLARGCRSVQVLAGGTPPDASPEQQAAILTAMRTMSHDAETQKCGCAIFALWAEPAAGALWSQHGVCEAASTALASFPNEGEVQREAFRLIRGLAQHDADVRDKLIQAGICPSIAKALEFYNVGVLRAACLASAALCANGVGEGQVQMLKESICGSVAAVMQSYEEDSALQSAACLAIIGLTTDTEDGRRQMRDNGVGKLIMAALKKHREDSDVQNYGWAAAACLARGDEEVQHNMVEDGACELLPVAMRLLTAAIAESASSFIQVIAGGNRIWRALLVQRGTCDALRSCMVASEMDLPGAKASCRAATSLCSESGEGRRRLLEAGGGEAILAFLRLGELGHKDLAAAEWKDAILHEVGMEAVLEMAREGLAGQERLVKAGACDVALSSMLAFPEEQNLLRFSCRLLATLASTPTQGKRHAEVDEGSSPEHILVRAGAVEAVTAAARTCPSDLDLVHSACSVACWLGSACSAGSADVASGNDGSRRLVEAGFCEVLLAALEAFPNDLHLQIQCCAAALCLSAAKPGSSPECDGRWRLTSAGGTAALLKAMRRFPKDIDLQRTCCRALAQMLSLPPSSVQAPEQTNKTEIVHDAASVLLDALHAWPEDEDLQYHGCWVIFLMSRWSTGARTLFIDGGACETALASLHKFEANEHMRWVSCSLLTTLALDCREGQRRLTQAGGSAAVLAAVRAVPWQHRCPGFA